jgi:SAM-dependent methyltransferase
MADELVRKYYSEQGIKEWRRLAFDPYRRLEFDTTMHFIKKYVPKKRALVLDAGGGPGRYTIELCKIGREVVLLDMSPDMLKIAKRQIKKHGVQKKVKQILQGSIDDLSMFENETFDCTLCLGGPLAHILDPARRERAINELKRVAKKDSPIFISVIGRYAVLVVELIRGPKEIELEIFPIVRDTGDYLGGYGFAPYHFYTPEELKETLEKKEIKILEMVGLEGLASGHQRETNKLARKQPKAWKEWWKTHLKTCTNPTSVGISEHFMAICKK